MRPSMKFTRLTNQRFGSSSIGDGVRVDAAVDRLRLTGIEFDAHTLRVIAEADGAVKVAMTQSPRR